VTPVDLPRVEPASEALLLVSQLAAAFGSIHFNGLRATRAPVKRIGHRQPLSGLSEVDGRQETDQ
jgi:hypothetical protein